MIQGAPSLPQITVSGFFTLTNAIGGPKAGGDFYSVRDVFSWTTGAHAVKLGGELSYNKTVQDTLLNNYGVLTFNNSVTRNALADFLIGIPSAMTQDAPVTALWNSWYGAALPAGRLPPQFAHDAESRAALGRADAGYRSAEPVHDLRARPEIHGQAGGADRAAVLRRSGRRARRDSDAARVTSRRVSASSGIPSATARRRSARPAAFSTGASRATSGTR